MRRVGDRLPQMVEAPPLQRRELVPGRIQIERLWTLFVIPASKMIPAIPHRQGIAPRTSAIAQGGRVNKRHIDDTHASSRT
jgi:hypothetical protein